MSEQYLFLNKFAAINHSELFNLSSEPYVHLVKFFETGVIDRTRTLECGFEYKTLDPLPELSPEVPDFEETILKRATTILKKAKEVGQRVLMLWSGGIDSTAALLALLEMCPDDPTQTIVLGSTHGSFLEFPEMGIHLMQRQFEILPLVHPVSRQIPADFLVVTGEHGDQLFGSDKMLPLVASGLGNLPYEKYLPLLMAEKLGTVEPVQKLMDYVRPVILKCPFKIKDICQCLWWFNYIFKWQQVSLRIPVWSGKPVQQLHDQCYHFYRSEDFQQWSLSKEDKNPSSPTFYKSELKEFIHRRFACENYLENKTKEISLRPRAEKKWWELSRHRWSYVVDKNWTLKKQIIPHYLGF
jgi:hypothetical protein